MAGEPTHIVVAGGSAGSIAPLRRMLAGLPGDLRAAMLVVIHVAPDSPEVLPEILSRAGALPAEPARDGARLVAGKVLVARPDQHLLVERGQAVVTRGPRENRHRPSIDVLFRSAAVAYGPSVVAVLLSGLLDDGAAGLWAVRQRGGYAIVQDPDDAEYADMPRSGLEAAGADAIVPADGLAAAVIAALARRGNPGVDSPHLAAEAALVQPGGSSMETMDSIGRRSALTCPDCGGALWDLSDAGGIRFRCHVGHAFSARSLLAEQEEHLEAALWAAMRALREAERLARRLSQNAASLGNVRSVRYHEDIARAHAAHAETLDRLLHGMPGDPSPVAASGEDG